MRQRPSIWKVALFDILPMFFVALAVHGGNIAVTLLLIAVAFFYLVTNEERKRKYDQSL